MPVRVVAERRAEIERVVRRGRIEQVGHRDDARTAAVDGRRARQPATGQHDQPRGVSARNRDRGERERQLARDAPLAIAGKRPHRRAGVEQQVHDDLAFGGEPPHEERVDQVDGELDAAEAQGEGLGERAYDERLPRAGDALDEDVAPREEAGEDRVQDLVVPDDGAGDLPPDGGEGVLEITDGGGGDLGTHGAPPPAGWAKSRRTSGANDAGTGMR